MSRIRAQFELQRGNFGLNLSLDLPNQGISALFGPSGSGKTTLLRCMAGLERAHGYLYLGEQCWQKESFFLPTHQRPLAYVFQEASLFPHLSVRDNLLFGYRRIPASQRKIELAQVVSWLGLNELLQRREPHALSGGERQRVAIGRALLCSPQLLLMDEPLSALDQTSKQEILPYLEALHRDLNIPVLYVSHALDEVIRLADQVVLLQAGKAIASGELLETLTQLELPLAHFDDACAVICGTIQQHDERYHLSQLVFEGGQLWCGKITQAIGSAARLRVLARDVSLATVAPQGSSINNILAASIAVIRDEGPEKVMVKLAVGQQHLLARITRRSHDMLKLQTGMAVYAQVKSVALM